MIQEKVLKNLDQFDQVALLRAKGFQTIGYVIKRGRVYFQFEDSPELNLILLDFKNNTIRMNPKEFGDELKRVVHLSKEILREVTTNGR